MKASFVELRKKSREIVRALDRNENVTLFYRGRPKAVLRSLASEAATHEKVRLHPAFGLWKERDDIADVAAHVRRLRQSRSDAV
ncbi:MAG: type II toxin-antitoxin system Phd/YefM family antitoxin [Gammaproteobacteria bacterium]